MAAERRRMTYSGRVQGVGFRYTTQQISRNYDVEGWVRNLRDGRVELVVEGEPQAVESFLEAIRIALGDKIHDAQSEPQIPGDPPVQGFLIRE